MKLTLDKCTKAQLIQIIGWLDPRGYSTRQYLNDLSFQKTEGLLDEMSSISTQLMRIVEKKCEIAKPYEGKPIKDIPLKVLDELSHQDDKYQELAKRWDKLNRQVYP